MGGCGGVSDAKPGDMWDQEGPSEKSHGHTDKGRAQTCSPNSGAWVRCRPQLRRWFMWRGREVLCEINFIPFKTYSRENLVTYFISSIITSFGHSCFYFSHLLSVWTVPWDHRRHSLKGPRVQRLSRHRACQQQPQFLPDWPSP